MTDTEEKPRSITTDHEQRSVEQRNIAPDVHHTKTDAVTVDEANAEAGPAAAAAGDAEFEARLRRLEQLRIQYGVSSAPSQS